jgi:hypothetical protein
MKQLMMAATGCHETGLERAPDRDALRAMSPERVLAALETGAMISMIPGNVLLAFSVDGQ